MKPEELLKQARKRYEDIGLYESTNREEALDDLRFLDGDQWPDELKKARENDQRPCLTINRLPAFVDQVIGDMRQNKVSADVIPVDDVGDPNTAKVFEGLIRNIEYSSNASRIYASAGESAVNCGYGAFRVLTRYVNDDSFDQEIYLKLIKNPFSVHIDPMAEMPDGSDAKHAFVDENIPRDEYEKRWPDKPAMSLDGAIQSGDNYRQWFMDNTVKIADYYWVDESETYELVLFSDGNAVKSDEVDDYIAELASLYYQEPVDKDDIAPLKDDVMEEMGIKEERRRKVRVKKVKYIKMSGSDILEGPTEWQGKYIPVIPVYGKELVVDGETKRRGVIRHAKDSQMQYNFWKTTSTETIALQPKAPWLLTQKQLENYEGRWNVANKENLSYLLYNHVDNQPRPERQPPPMGSPAMFSEAASAAEDMKATTGIYDASLGARSNEKSGVAIRERKQEGDVANFAYHDNLADSVTHCARILVDLIPKIYDTGRVVRILGDGDEQNLVPINQPFNVPQEDGSNVESIYELDAGKYDVRAKVGPSYTTQRQETQDFLIGVMDALPPQAGVALAPLIFKNSDFKDADEVVERLEEIYAMSKGIPPEGAVPPGAQQPPGSPGV